MGALVNSGLHAHPLNFPNLLSGGNPLVPWLNGLLKAGKASRIKPGRGYRVKVSPEGTILEIDALGGGGAAAPALSLQRFRLKSIGANTLTCRTWDGSSEGATDVLVAKPTKLRNAIVTELIDARVITYSYPSNIERVAAATGFPDEQQNIVPRYLGPYSYVNAQAQTVTYSGDEIYAAQFSTPIIATPTPVYYLDVNVDGRAWAKKYGT